MFESKIFVILQLRLFSVVLKRFSRAAQLLSTMGASSTLAISLSLFLCSHTHTCMRRQEWEEGAIKCLQPMVCTGPRRHARAFPSFPAHPAARPPTCHPHRHKKQHWLICGCCRSCALCRKGGFISLLIVASHQYISISYKGRQYFLRPGNVSQHIRMIVGKRRRAHFSKPGCAAGCGVCRAKALRRICGSGINRPHITPATCHARHAKTENVNYGTGNRGVLAVRSVDGANDAYRVFPRYALCVSLTSCNILENYFSLIPYFYIKLM